MERSRELRGIMLAIYDDWSRGDDSWVDLFAPDADVLVIGTDPDEWWEGGDNVRAIFKQQDAELGSVRIEAGRLQAFASGDVGWAADEANMTLPSGLSRRGRLTVVFERRGGAWVIVQWHASFPQSNVDTIGVELTTSIDALAAWAGEVKPDLAPSAASDGTVTIVFTDIEGSTALNVEVGDHRWLEIIRAHESSVRSAVSAHDGTTVKGAGDGFMLAFPSARKSVECAIAMQRGLHASEIPATVRMRIGMHTGEPLRHGGDFFGQDVAFAARVGAAASGGEILVSSLVRDLCAGAAFGFHEPREVEFKGFEGPQDVYAVVWTP